MNKKIPTVINAKGRTVAVLADSANEDYISLTDIAGYKNDDTNSVIQNWMRGRDTIDFLGLWEELNNPDFNCLEFEAIKADSGANSFVLTPKYQICTFIEERVSKPTDFFSKASGKSLFG